MFLNQDGPSATDDGPHDFEELASDDGPHRGEAEESSDEEVFSSGEEATSSNSAETSSDEAETPSDDGENSPDEGGATTEETGDNTDRTGVVATTGYANDDVPSGSNLENGMSPAPTLPDLSAGINVSGLTQIDFCDLRIDDSVIEMDQEPFIMEELSDFDFGASASDIHIRRGFTNPGRPPSRSTSEQIREIELEYEEHARQQRQIREQEEAEALALQLKKDAELAGLKDERRNEEVKDCDGTNHEPLIPPTGGGSLKTEGQEIQGGQRKVLGHDVGRQHLPPK